MCRFFLFLTLFCLWGGLSLAQSPCLNRQELAARSAGIITKILLKDGALVKKNQPILELDDRLLRAGLKESEGALEHELAGEKFAEDTLRRLEKLKLGDTVTEQQMVEARYKLAEARAARKQAEGALERLKVQIQDTVIRAGIEGTVQGLPTVLGLYVQVGQSLGRIEGDPQQCQP